MSGPAAVVIAALAVGLFDVYWKMRYLRSQVQALREWNSQLAARVWTLEGEPEAPRPKLLTLNQQGDPL